jgi:hypothetical protein
VHTSETGSQLPTEGRHDVPAAAGAPSAGHAALEPSHTSATGSHAPIDGLQTVPADDFRSAGQDVDRPLQTSAGSHPPVEARQVVLDAAVTVPQVPFDGAPAAVLHAWQLVVRPPSHAVAQHTLSTQKVDAH